MILVAGSGQNNMVLASWRCPSGYIYNTAEKQKGKQLHRAGPSKGWPCCVTTCSVEMPSILQDSMCSLFVIVESACNLITFSYWFYHVRTLTLLAKLLEYVSLRDKVHLLFNFQK